MQSIEQNFNNSRWKCSEVKCQLIVEFLTSINMKAIWLFRTLFYENLVDEIDTLNEAHDEQHVQTQPEIFTAFECIDTNENISIWAFDCC